MMATVSLWHGMEHGTRPQRILHTTGAHTQPTTYPKTITDKGSFCANNLRLYWSIGRNRPNTDWRARAQMRAPASYKNV